MRRLALAILALTALSIGVLTACSDEPDPVPTIDAGPPPTTTAAPAAGSFGDQTRSPRGNLVKEIGQPGAVNDDVVGIVLEFRVDSITQNAPCQAEGYTDEPENGQFLAVDVFATTTPAFDPTMQDTSFLGTSWTVVTADGVRHNVSTGPAIGCSQSSNLLNLTPAITVTGTVLLDAPTDLDGAVVILSNALVDGGWEWAVPI